MLLAAAAGAALLVPTALMESGVGIAAPSASQAQYTPVNTAPPTISGSTVQGQTLTTTPGSWTSSTNVSFTYQWVRCNTTGGGCVNLNGATNSAYVTQPADVGSTIRVTVTAHNADGATSSTSAKTGTITSTNPPPTTTTTPPAGGKSVPVSSLSLPDRLTIDKVKFTPSVVRSLTTMTGRFHVTDANKYDVAGALVYAIGLPYSRVTPIPEAATGTDGWVTMQFQPEKLFPRRGYVTFFVRARKAGEPVLGGISTRRLVQLTINR